jgi:hypothetical protein
MTHITADCYAEKTTTKFEICQPTSVWTWDTLLCQEYSARTASLITKIDVFVDIHEVCPDFPRKRSVDYPDFNITCLVDRTPINSLTLRTEDSVDTGFVQDGNLRVTKLNCIHTLYATNYARVPGTFFDPPTCKTLSSET